MYNSIPKYTRIVLESQDKLGCRPFICGMIATSWENDQEKWCIKATCLPENIRMLRN